MERIKDLSKVILRGDMVLAEIVEAKTDSGIILPDSAKGGFDYMVIIALGKDVDTLSVGDIVIDVSGTVDVYPIGNKKIARMAKNNIAIAVSADNFDPAAKKIKFGSKLIH